MTKADDKPSTGWRSLEDALEPWFESEEKFDKLPEDFQALFRRDNLPPSVVIASLWNHCSPDRRRQIVRQRDYQTHPGLAAATETIWEKMAAVYRWQRVASNKSELDREALDVKAQDEEVDRAQKELAAAEAVLEREVKGLGLGWPYDAARITGPSAPAPAPTGTAAPRTVASAPLTLPTPKPVASLAVGRVPYDVMRASALLDAEKTNGVFRARIPTILECKTYLLTHFSGIPAEKHREAVRAVWPNVPAGPRKKR